MTNGPWNVLVLCTGNSARSIMAEALINTMGAGRFVAYSAGSHPSGTVNPFAIEQIVSLGYPTTELRSKSWDEFAAPAAPMLDLVITVCDAAAGEVCPFWPGQPLKAHWGFEDPAAAVGSDDEKRRVFARVFGRIRDCIERFVNLPLGELDRDAIRAELDAIGHAEKATAP